MNLAADVSATLEHMLRRFRLDLSTLEAMAATYGGEELAPPWIVERVRRQRARIASYEQMLVAFGANEVAFGE